MDQILSLPLYPELTEEAIQTVVGAIKDFYVQNDKLSLAMKDGIALKEAMKRKSPVFILAGILVVGIVTTGVFLYRFYRQPLNQPLVLQPQATTGETESIDIDSPLPTQTATAPVSKADSMSGKVCGRSGAFTLLIVGSDAADKRGRPGGDLTRLARIDYSQKLVSIFALPRDLWVDVSSLEFQNPAITNTALGETYYEAHLRSGQAEQSDKMSDGARADSPSDSRQFRSDQRSLPCARPDPIASINRCRWWVSYHCPRTDDGSLDRHGHRGWPTSSDGPATRSLCPRHPQF